MKLRRPAQLSSGLTLLRRPNGRRYVYPLFGAGGGGGPPSLPTGLLAAWDMASASQYTTSGANLTGMTDLTGNGHHITSLPTAPQVVTLLGETWLDFASSKYMTIPVTVSCDQRNCAVFVVSQQTGTTGSARAASLGDGLNMGVGWTGDAMPSGELSRGTNLSASAPNKLWAGFGWQLHGRVNTAAESRFWLDLENKATTAVSSATVTGGEIGRNTFNSSNYWNSRLKGVYVFSPAPDSTQLAALRAYCQYHFRVGSDAMDTCVVVDGDSITAGGTSGALPWAFFMGSEASVGQANIRPKFRNYATGGHTVQQVLDGLANPIAWFADQSSYTRKLWIGMAGINSIGTVSEADMKTQLASIVTTLHADGIEVALLTILPTVGISDETKRQNVNTWLVAGSSGADYVVDLRAVTGLTDPSNTTYFSDGTHPTSAGEKIIGNVVFAQLFPA